MRRLGRSSGHESSQSSDTMQRTSDVMRWSVPTEEFEYAEKDPDADSHPVKRRQRRQRLRGLHSFNSYVARTGIVAVAASASMLSRQMESFARVEGGSHLERHHDGELSGGGIGATLSAAVAGFRSCLGSFLGTAVARVGELASSLADAIGEPPQRVLAGTREEHELPTVLPFAINLCILLTLASLFFFMFAFCANQVASSDASDPDAIDKTQVSAQNGLSGTVADTAAETNHELHGLFRRLVVFCLSLITGGVLGVRHPLQSAVLCGC